jgi:tRNA G26 N,N-dimethylase Trm1
VAKWILDGYYRSFARLVHDPKRENVHLIKNCYKCSACQKFTSVYAWLPIDLVYRRCPKCGAKMEKEDK